MERVDIRTTPERKEEKRGGDTLDQGKHDKSSQEQIERLKFLCQQKEYSLQLKARELENQLHEIAQKREERKHLLEDLARKDDTIRLLARETQKLQGEFEKGSKSLYWAMAKELKKATKNVKKRDELSEKKKKNYEDREKLLRERIQQLKGLLIQLSERQKSIRKKRHEKEEEEEDEKEDRELEKTEEETSGEIVERKPKNKKDKKKDKKKSKKQKKTMKAMEKCLKKAVKKKGNKKDCKKLNKKKKNMKVLFKIILAELPDAPKKERKNLISSLTAKHLRKYKIVKKKKACKKISKAFSEMMFKKVKKLLK
jgi:hypothetical protein